MLQDDSFTFTSSDHVTTTTNTNMTWGDHHMNAAQRKSVDDHQPT